MTYLLAGLCLLVPLCWLSGFAVGRSDARVRSARRHPGYVQLSPPAFDSASQVTGVQRLTSTESKGRAVFTPGLGTYPGGVRISSPTDSGSVTEFPLGGRMTAADGAA